MAHLLVTASNSVPACWNAGPGAGGGPAAPSPKEGSDVSHLTWNCQIGQKMVLIVVIFLP